MESCSHLLIHFLGHSPLRCINRPSSSHRLPSQQTVTCLSAYSHSYVFKQSFSPSSPLTSMLTNLFLFTLQGGFYLKCVFQRNHSLSGWPCKLSMKTLALMCSSYQEFPSDLNFLPLICPSLCIDFMTDLSVFVFTQVTDFTTWDGRQSVSLEPSKTYTSDPRSPAAAFFVCFPFLLYHMASGILVPEPRVEPTPAPPPLPWKNRILTTEPPGSPLLPLICDFTPLNLSFLICRMGTIISFTLCHCGEG